VVKLAELEARAAPQQANRRLIQVKALKSRRRRIIFLGCNTAIISSKERVVVVVVMVVVVVVAIISSQHRVRTRNRSNTTTNIWKVK